MGRGAHALYGPILVGGDDVELTGEGPQVQPLVVGQHEVRRHRSVAELADRIALLRTQAPRRPDSSGVGAASHVTAAAALTKLLRFNS